MVQVTKKVTLIHGFKGIEEGLTKEVTFRDATAGDLIEIRSGLTAGDAVVGAGSFHLKTALLRERIGDEH